MNKKMLHADIPLHDSSAFSRRLQSRRRVVQSFEVKNNRDRTISEKIADTMTARFGSMTFLTLNALWFLSWILINTGYIPNISPFDPFPFGLLTMVVSLEAIFLAIIVLISQNRGAKIDDLREEVGLQITTIAEEEITKMMELQILLLKKQGIDVSSDSELAQMIEPIDSEAIEEKLKKQFQ
jgi:uncharacterized membrane protein